MTATVACPFLRCDAHVRVIEEQGPPGSVVRRVERHEIGGDASWWGQCPASLLGWPIEETAAVLLSEALFAIDREERRRGMTEPGDERPTEAVSPPAATSPAGPMWTPGLGNGDAAGGSVRQVRAELAAINATMAGIGSECRNQLEGEAQAALARLNLLRTGSSGELAAPHLTAIIEALNTIAALCVAGIEANDEYLGRL